MKNKFTFWLILLLIIANVFTMSVFWLGRINNHPRPPGRGPKDFIIRELGFDVEQQKQYEELISEHHQRAEVLQDSIKEAKETFFNLLKDPSVNENAKRSAATAISKQTEKLDLLTFDHFQKIRMICTNEQKKKFDSIIRQVIDMMGHPRPPGPQERNGPPPNGPSL